MPVYNEEKTIKQVLKKLVDNKWVSEIVVVNDGSTDGTEKEIAKIKSAKIKLVNKTNGGKGSAIRAAVDKATGDYVLIQDGDLEYDPNEIEVLMKPIVDRGVEVVYGSRFLGAHSNLLFWHRVGNWFLNAVINVVYNTTLSDMETCYKLIPRKMMLELKLKSDKFDLEPEITCKLLKRGVKIFEVPITYVGRDFNEGKKITWRDGFGALQTIASLRFSDE